MYEGELLTPPESRSLTSLSQVLPKFESVVLLWADAYPPTLIPESPSCLECSWLQTFPPTP